MTNRSNAELLDLSGESAIVTGGAQGIGEAISVRLANAGASVMVADIDLEAAERTVDEIRASGGKAQAVKADASNRDDVKAMIRSAVDAFGGIDVLVNNAGVFILSPVQQTTADIVNKTFDINLKGAFFCSQLAAEEMIKRERGGKIVNISSAEAMRPTRGLAHYDASKGGVISLTQAMALEYARYKIRINSIAPAGIITPGVRKMTQAGVDVSGKTEDELMSRRAKRMACGGMATGYAIFLLTAHPAVIGIVLVGLVMAGCALYIATRPTAQN